VAKADKLHVILSPIQYVRLYRTRQAFYCGREKPHRTSAIDYGYRACKYEGDNGATLPALGQGGQQLGAVRVALAVLRLRELGHKLAGVNVMA
jgi:hypothetical protein